MFTVASSIDCTEYRIALLCPTTGAVLAAKSSDGRWCLPHVRIPFPTRVAHALRKAVEMTWNVQGIVLDTLPSGKGSLPCAILELQCNEGCATLTKIALDQLTDDLSDREQDFLFSVLSDRAERPLSRIGWLDEAVLWVEDTTADRVRSKRRIEQFNAGGHFALLRFPMQSGHSYWLKATGEPNRHELPVTSYLSKLCPGCVPQVLAVRPEWNAWIMPEIGTAHEALSADPKRCFELFDRAITAIAEIQCKTVGCEKDFLGIGAFDQRTETLLSDSKLLFERIDEAMHLQTSTKAPPVQRSQLQALECVFNATCEFIQSLKIPSTVLHGDLNGGNVLYGAGYCQVIDWSETYIGHPFVCLQNVLLWHESSTLRVGPAESKALIDRHLAVMRQVCDDTALRAALPCLPLMGAASTLYGRGAWLHSAFAERPQKAAWVRTLTRYMDRAAHDPALLNTISNRSVVCVG